jgi:autotransporter-associated beta strand protein
LLPTFVSLAGGDSNTLETDGVNVIPYLSGDRAGDPHDVMHWRAAGNRFAIRKGDWKLTRSQGGTGLPRLFNLATDLTESTNLAGEQPAIVSELRRELAYWEATLEKPQWWSFGAPNFNLFDHFVFRHEVAPTATWSAAGQWQQVSGTTATLNPQDAFANAVLEFRTSDNGDYIATNDMVRATLETFMLNEIRLTGEHQGLSHHQATINGNGLLFVMSLEGQTPRISLEATAAPSAAPFRFDLANELQLLHDLEIGGDGTQLLEISGAIVDFYEPRGVTKTGTSSIRLSGNNTYTGDTTVEEGEMSIVRPFLADAADVRLSSGAALELDFSGSDTIGTLFLDGIAQLSGTWGAMGNAAADFETDLIAGDGLLYVSSGRRRGDFDGDGVVNLADYLVLRKGLGNNVDEALLVEWRANFGKTPSGLAGDHNGDGAVDSADYVLLREGLGTVYGQLEYDEWLANFGTQLLAPDGDFNSDGSVDVADYIAWRIGFGTIYDQSHYEQWRASYGAGDSSAAGNLLAVPEPAAWVILSLALVGFVSSAITRRAAACG